MWPGKCFPMLRAEMSLFLLGLHDSNFSNSRLPAGYLQRCVVCTSSLTLLFVLLQPDLKCLKEAIMTQSPELVQLVITAGADPETEDKVMYHSTSVVECSLNNQSHLSNGYRMERQHSWLHALLETQMLWGYCSTRLLMSTLKKKCVVWPSSVCNIKLSQYWYTSHFSTCSIFGCNSTNLLRWWRETIGKGQNCSLLCCCGRK